MNKLAFLIAMFLPACAFADGFSFSFRVGGYRPQPVYCAPPVHYVPTVYYPTVVYVPAATPPAVYCSPPIVYQPVYALPRVIYGYPRVGFYFSTRR
jgi:hypothetical protein